MARFLIRRSLLLILTVWVASMLIFALTQLLPGNVARLILGRDARPEAIAQFNERFGLDEPVVMQYLRWLRGFVVGDWGTSFTGINAEVRPLVLERFGKSLILAAFTLLLSVPIGVGLGVLAALRENTWVDGLVSIGSLSVIGLPEFVTGILLIQVFALQLGWFDAIAIIPPDLGFIGWLRVLTLPAVTASFVLVGYITRMTRAGMMEELRKNYVRTARLKGLPEWQVIWKHVLRNALLPTITVIGISVGWLIGGIVVIENVFRYPGVGSLLIQAVEQKNLPVLQATTLLIVIAFSVSNLAADLLYTLLNPRIRLR
ncbi:MAG: ABC transporter permease [Phototrophicaceae bacterium]|jgi:peptide/nickel transport system permease protein